LPGTPAAAIVITGAMAAGKSTVAQQLAERLPRAAHVRGDVFRRMIVSGREEFEPRPTAEATAQLWLRYQLAAATADGYARAGFTAVVQDVILGPDLARYVDLLTTRPRFVVVLAPRPDVLTERERVRDKTGYGDWTVESLDNSLRHETPRLGLWLDTSHQTPEQTVAEIMARMPEARLPD
jgi:predicted kinase